MSTPSRRRAALLTVAVIVAAGGASLLVAEKTGSDTETEAVQRVAAVDEGPGTARDAWMAHYGQLKLALAPMLVHVRDLSQALTAPARGDAAVVPAEMASGWAEASASARDLAQRLAVPPGPAGEAASALNVTAVLLDREAALAGASLTSLPPSDRADAGRAGLRLLLLRDRAFDSARRLFGSAVGTGYELVLPAPVPNFAKEGLRPANAGPPVPGGSGYADPDASVAHPEEWASRHADRVAGLLTKLRSRPGQADLVGELERAADDFGTPTLPEGAGREGTVALRLGFLAHIEALHAAPWGDASARLAGIGDRLLASAGILLRSAGLDAPLPDAGTVRPTPHRGLWSGGVFDGDPPPLKPGDDPRSGLPLPLPVADPATILR